MNNLNKVGYLVIAIAALIAGLWLRGCFVKTPASNKPVVSADFPSTDTVRVAVKGPTLEVQTPTETEYKYVPDEGQAVIDVQKTGKPVIAVTNKGITHQVGVDLFVADKLRAGGDIELAYWNRFGLHLGFGVASSPLFVGFVSGSYQLDQLHLNNTSLWIGYTSNKLFACGIRVRL